MTSSHKPKAVIYCRIASSNQRGKTSNTQEMRCREYAKNQGYDIVKVFQDEGLSGNDTERPGFKTMLEYIKGQSEPIVVIIDDISRLARNLAVHLQLREDIASVGGILKSPSFVFGDDPASKLFKHIMVAKEQLLMQEKEEC